MQRRGTPGFGQGPGALATATRRGRRPRKQLARWPAVIAAVRLLAPTGPRKSEILGLKWEWIDFSAGRANLPDSKTGEKAVILPPAALSVLASLKRVEGNPFVNPGGKG